MKPPVEPGRHDATLYRDHRPDYPPELFLDLKESLAGTHDPSKLLHVLDLGCGTGQSIRSAHRALGQTPVQWWGVDPSPAMLRGAEANLREIEPPPRLELGNAEKIPLPDHAVDLVIIASAWHWFEPIAALREIQRCLRPGPGLGASPILILEYQFPTCLDHPALSDWVRRSFNGRWKFEDQKPRGKLRDLVKGLPLQVTRSRKLKWEVQLDRPARVAVAFAFAGAGT